MKARVAINGFGRTGRQALKAIWLQHAEGLEIAAIGLADLIDAKAAAHLLKHDSNYGRFAPPVEVRDSSLLIADKRIPLVSAPSPEGLPWRDLGIDVVIEASGEFTGAGARGHLDAGAGTVVVTAASEDADLTLIHGVNDDAYDGERHRVVATDTETTNAIAVVLAALHERVAIEHVLVTAVRAYTNQQKLIDTTDVELRRARSAPVSIVPTTSRAARAVAGVLPSLAGRIDGYAVRVPVAVVGIVELTLRLTQPTDAARINDVLREAAVGPLGRVLAVTDEPLVSSDYRGSRYSAVVDAPLTMTIGPLAKVSAWYDNEWGYSSRVADVACLIADRTRRA